MFYRAKKCVRQVYKQFSTRTTMHGFAELYISKSAYGKLFWIFALSICLAIMFFQLTKAVIQYVNEPYITVIQRIKEEEMSYPHLSICYNHWIYWVDFKRAADLNFTKPSVLYGLSFLTDIYSENHFETAEAEQQFSLSMQLNNFSRLTEFYFAIAAPPPVPPVNHATYFNEKYMDTGIFCYKTNSSLLIKDAKKEARIHNVRNNKLEVIFNIKPPQVEALRDGFMSIEEHDCYIAQSLYYNTYIPIQKEFFISKNKTRKRQLSMTTFLVVDYDIIQIHWDDLLILVQSRAMVSKWQNTEDHPCRKNSTSTNSDQSCQKTCEQQYKNDICQYSFFNDVLKLSADFPKNLSRNGIHFLTSLENECIVGMFPRMENVKKKKALNVSLANCTYGEDFCCADADYEKNQYDACLKQCTTGCTVWSYYLGNVQYSKLGMFKDAVVAATACTVYMYFPTYEEVLSTNEIGNQSLENFVGNIGGLLGVWTGASILSLLQLVYLCCCGEFCYCTKRNIDTLESVTVNSQMNNDTTTIV